MSGKITDGSIGHLNLYIYFFLLDIYVGLHLEFLFNQVDPTELSNLCYQGDLAKIASFQVSEKHSNFFHQC